MSIPKSNNRRKYILDANSNLQTASEKLANEGIKYFSDSFNAHTHTHQYSGITCKKILSASAKDSLTKPFLLEEIKEALFHIEDNSSPGPDGLSSKFYKIHWEQIKM